MCNIALNTNPVVVYVHCLGHPTYMLGQLPANPVLYTCRLDSSKQVGHIPAVYCVLLQAIAPQTQREGEFIRISKTNQWYPTKIPYSNIVYLKLSIMEH